MSGGFQDILSDSEGLQGEDAWMNNPMVGDQGGHQTARITNGGHQMEDGWDGQQEVKDVQDGHQRKDVEDGQQIAAAQDDQWVESDDDI